jgi:hypothetical protein
MWPHQYSRKSGPGSFGWGLTHGRHENLSSLLGSARAYTPHTTPVTPATPTTPLFSLLPCSCDEYNPGHLTHLCTARMELLKWGSDVPLLVWQLVLGLMAWEGGVTGAFRAMCSGWRDVHDALLPRLEPGYPEDEWMRGRWGRFPSVATVKLCPTATFLPLLPELQSLPLTNLQLVFSGWMRACDMQALTQSLPKLSSLSIADDSDDEGGDEDFEEGDMVGLSELSSLDFTRCSSPGLGHTRAK